MTDKHASTDDSKWLLGLAAIAVVAVTAMVLGYAGLLIYFTWPIDELSLGKAGLLGDSFGALNTLFSGLAFAGLIIAILLQRADLRLQQNELRLTREEVQSQNFENTFFQMLRLHNDIVSAMRVEYHEKWMTDDGPDSRTSPVSGRDCFLEFTRRFERNLDRRPYHGEDPGELSTVSRAYREFWKENQQTLGHYFRYLYRIFFFIDQSRTEDKLLYSGIARAQLSDLELLLLFYNCLSEYGVEKFKPLAEKYALFDNLPIKMIIHGNHLKLFELSAWGAQANAVKQSLSRSAREPEGTGQGSGESQENGSDCEVE